MPEPTTPVSPAATVTTTTIGLPGGFNVQIPKWTSTFFGIIAVVAIGFGVYRYFFPPVPELVTVKQANEQLQLEVNHYNRHIVDVPVASMEDNIDHDSVTAAKVGHVVVRVFADGCLLISRKVGEMSNTRLLVDPSNVPQTRAFRVPEVPSLIPTVAAAPQGCPGHPPNKPFQATYGKKVECWVEVIREFEDKCSQVQMFNTCTNAWATNADGSPQVQWTHCVH